MCSRLRTINLIPIDYAFRPRLRGRLTLRGLALRRKPRAYGGGGSRPPLATHASILISDTSTVIHNTASAVYRALSYHLFIKEQIHSFGDILSPANFRRGITRPVSYYAFFKG